MKVALVTGAAQGLGLATAALLAQRGFHIVATDIQPLEGALARIDGGGCVGIRGDISRGLGGRPRRRRTPKRDDSDRRWRLVGGCELGKLAPAHAGMRPAPGL